MEPGIRESALKEVLHRHSEVGGRSADLPPSQKNALSASTNHSLSDLSSKNQRGEACGHFPLSESQNKNQTVEESLIEHGFGLEEEHILECFP